MNKKIALLSAAMLLSSTAWAGALTIPNTFTAGSPAVAADVNANFTAAKTAVDDNNTRINANAAAATTNATNIAANTTSAATNATNIAANTAAAATNATNIAANTTNIATNTAAAATNATNITANTIAITALQLTNPVTTVISVPAGGTAVANGTALMNAVAGITGSSPTNQFTVKLAVGTYDLGTQMLQLPDGTNLEGVAPMLTTVTSAVAGTTTSILPYGGTVRALGSSKISRLTLNQTKLGDNWPAGALNASNGSVLLDQVEMLGDIPMMIDGGKALTLVVQHSRVIPNAFRQIYEGGIVNNLLNFAVLNSVFGAVGDTPGINSASHCFSSTHTNGSIVTATCN